MLTNKLGLPQPIVNAVERDFHQAGDYSASQMTKPIQMVHLEKRHNAEVVEDVSDNIWALLGKGVHAILEMGEDHDHLVESYFKENVNGVLLTGMSDLYHDAVVYDYKVTSAWSWVFRADKMKDWESQLNIYAWFFRMAGFPVNALTIVMILRDWQKSKALSDPKGYPQAMVQALSVRLWSMEYTRAYIEKRIGEYELFKTVPDAQLPECTLEERWADAPKFAVVKPGVKTAKRVLDTKEAAADWINDALSKGTKGPLEIEERPGNNWKRCEYCRVQAFCHQYRRREDSNGITIEVE